MGRQDTPTCAITVYVTVPERSFPISLSHRTFAQSPIRTYGLFDNSHVCTLRTLSHRCTHIRVTFCTHTPIRTHTNSHAHQFARPRTSLLLHAPHNTTHTSLRVLLFVFTHFERLLYTPTNQNLNSVSIQPDESNELQKRFREDEDEHEHEQGEHEHE